MAAMLTNYPEIVGGFSSRVDGTMAIVGGFDNRQKYLAAQGCDSARTVHAGLSHGIGVAVVTADDAGKIMADTDGLITAEKNLGLAMTAADCLLISVYDPVQHIIGMVHAGSKGLALQVVSVFLQAWENFSPTDPRNLVVDVSPSICPDHYPVTLDQARLFTKWPDACQKRADRVHLDLRKIASHQLLAAGASSENITISPRCTFEDSLLYSYRRDHPISPQLQVGYLSRRG